MLECSYFGSEPKCTEWTGCYDSAFLVAKTVMFCVFLLCKTVLVHSTFSFKSVQLFFCSWMYDSVTLLFPCISTYMPCIVVWLPDCLSSRGGIICCIYEELILSQPAPNPLQSVSFVFTAVLWVLVVRQRNSSLRNQKPADWATAGLFVPLEIQTSVKHGPGPKTWYKSSCSLKPK